MASLIKTLLEHKRELEKQIGLVLKELDKTVMGVPSRELIQLYDKLNAELNVVKATLKKKGYKG